MGIVGLAAAYTALPPLRLVGATPTAAPPMTLLATVVFLGGALMATAAIASPR